MAKDAKGHGSEGRGSSAWGTGGKLDPKRPTIEVHQSPQGVLGHFMGGQSVSRSYAEDQSGRGNARLVTIPVRDQQHSDDIVRSGSGVTGGSTRLGGKK